MPNKRVSQLQETNYDLEDKIVVNQSGVTKVVRAYNVPGALDLTEDKTYVYTNGKLTAVNGATVSKTLSYNLQDQLETVVTTTAFKTETKTFTYDIDGNLIAVTIS